MVLPVINEGVAGNGLTVVAKLLDAPFPQAFDGVTVTLPEVAPTVTVIEFVVPPDVWLQPEGNTQL